MKSKSGLSVMMDHEALTGKNIISKYLKEVRKSAMQVSREGHSKQKNQYIQKAQRKST